MYAEYDYYQYAEVVGAALGYELIGGSDACAATIADGVAALAALVASTSPMGASDEIPEGYDQCVG